MKLNGFYLAGTITQLFGAGESECSVIMLWTYGLASVALTFWSTFFMWLVGLNSCNFTCVFVRDRKEDISGYLVTVKSQKVLRGDR